MLDDVQHQDGAVAYLRGVIEGRVISPLLLVGLEGTGRKFAALQTAREIFCSGDRSKTCGCFDCLQFNQGMHPDLLQLIPEDGKDIGIEAARTAIEAIQSYPSQAKLRVVIIDGADRLTAPAANALLKTLEEPPPTVRVLLIAESAAHVIPTIRSRCGILNFRPLPEGFVLQSLQKFESDPTKALVYTRLSEGSLGKAIQFWGSGRLALRDKALSLLSSALNRDVAGVFLLIDQLEKDLPLTLRFLDTLVHDLLLLRVAPERLINGDILDVLGKMRPPSANSWAVLHEGLRDTLATSRHTKIQLGFHAKTLLLQTFVGV